MKKVVLLLTVVLLLAAASAVLADEPETLIWGGKTGQTSDCGSWYGDAAIANPCPELYNGTPNNGISFADEEYAQRNESETIWTCTGDESTFDPRLYGSLDAFDYATYGFEDFKVNVSAKVDGVWYVDTATWYAAGDRWLFSIDLPHSEEGTTLTRMKVKAWRQDSPVSFIATTEFYMHQHCSP